MRSIFSLAAMAIGLAISTAASSAQAQTVIHHYPSAFVTGTPHGIVTSSYFANPLTAGAVSYPYGVRVYSYSPYFYYGSGYPTYGWQSSRYYGYGYRPFFRPWRWRSW